MNAKNVAGFLLCKPAFSKRNMTSLALVGIFMATYILAGGKISTTLPQMKNMMGLAPSGEKVQDLDSVGTGKKVMTEEDSKKILGIKPSEDLAARERSAAVKGSLFTPEERKQEEAKPVDKEGLVQGIPRFDRREEVKLEKAERKQTDSLSAIEDRLKIKHIGRSSTGITRGGS